jgi:hypothetical protein
LTRGGRPSRTVAWANACRGPWGCDIATCRLNLIGSEGAKAADGFQPAYESLTSRTPHPYWELACVLETGVSRWAPQRVAKLESYLERAVQAMTDTPSHR